VAKAERLLLLAPLSGPLLPIEQVPDPVFSGKLVGEGVSIDPETTCLRAPCEARVLQIHPAGHAVNLLSPEGVEVMIHIGLDTVALKGEGFLPRVRAGERVSAGQPLIDFAADYVATRAASLLTQLVVPASERVASVSARAGRAEAGRDVVLEVVLAGAPAGAGVSAEATGEGAVVSEPVAVGLATGLHARPAAVLAAAAKRYRSRLRLLRGDAAANARSVTAIMGLEVGAGDAVRVEGSGPDAAEAVAALRELLAGLREEGEAPMAPAAPPRAAARPSGDDPNQLRGVPASPGLAVGEVFQLRRQEIAVAEESAGANAERQRLDRALEQGRLQLEALEARLRGEADPAKAAIFAAHSELLEDPDLLEAAQRGIEAGRSAAAGWRDAVDEHAQRLAGSRNELLAARANDLRDVGRRVLRLLAGEAQAEAAPAFPPRAILIAEDLAPSETAGLDRSKVLGFCTVAGGATSHVAILARSLDIPALAGIEPRALEIADGTPVVLDGTQGTLRLRPGQAEMTAIHARQERLSARRRADAAAAHQPAVTRDGARIEVAANVGGVNDARHAVALGAEGVGLLRSEFLFLQRASAPSEDEQHEVYAAIARTLGPERPLVVRTLDVGGDKPLAYLPLPREENPFLGVRGLRLQLERPELLRTQLRAILRASSQGRLSVMLPMVATLAEFRAAKAILEQERERLGVRPLPLGIMIEVPAAALLADVFALEADFFSIGTNDLTQYVLAMDRGHPGLAAGVDGLEPSVLRLIGQAARAGREQGRWVGVCGGLAGDAQAVPILLGLGVTELSVSVPTIPAIKARVRELDLAACQALAQRALAAGSAAEVRALLPDPLALEAGP
jgi:phosphocarrier protein FPr